MSAFSPLLPEVTPPAAAPASTHAAVPGAATSAAFTAGDAVASAQAMATVPTNTASTGMRGSPWASAQAPDRSAAARPGAPTPPPTHSTTLGAARSRA